MKKENPALRCYIAAFTNCRLDPFLEEFGFSRGMVCFAIPSYGILFRCRTTGSLIDLEFGAMFSLLEFIKSKLKSEKVRSVEIYSSDPELVFAFSENSRHMKRGSTRRTLLEEYARAMRISVGYVRPAENRALVSPAEYPSLPAGISIKLELDAEELKGMDFKPYHKGVKI